VQQNALIECILYF